MTYLILYALGVVAFAAIGVNHWRRFSNGYETRLAWVCAILAYTVVWPVLIGFICACAIVHFVREAERAG
jgi:hypothetical protein